MLENHMWWLFRSLWDLMSVFVSSKRMKYSLSCYHFQYPTSSKMSNPPFFIDVIENGVSMIMRFMSIASTATSIVLLCRWTQQSLGLIQLTFIFGAPISCHLITIFPCSCQRLSFHLSPIHCLWMMLCPISYLILHLITLRLLPLLQFLHDWCYLSLVYQWWQICWILCLRMKKRSWRRIHLFRRISSRS